MIRIVFFGIVAIHAVLCKGQNIYTFAGNGSVGYCCDGLNAAVAQISNPVGVAVDASGNVYIADYLNHRIRKVNTSGIISTIAGTGIAGFSGDGGPAISAQIYDPHGVSIDASGNIYIADQGNNRIRKVNVSGIITTIAGTGGTGYSGDGGLAISAQIYGPTAIAIDASNNILIADLGNNRIRKVNTSGTITTIAGTGTSGFSGDGGNAISAQINFPNAIAVDLSGNIFIADANNKRIRKINTSGIINTVAGTGTNGFSGDGGLATSAQLSFPFGVAVDVSNNIYIADNPNHRIRKVNASGIINTIVGNGIGSFSGDGGLATSAQIFAPYSVAVDVSNNIYIADWANVRIRVICVSSCLAGINDLIVKPNETKISPNPNSGSFKLQLADEINYAELILINSLGQKIHEQKISSGENNIVTNGLPKGLYHYILLSNKQQVNKGKIVIE